MKSSEKEHDRQKKRIKHAREVRQERAFNRGVAILRAYIEDTGSADVPVTYIRASGDEQYRLGHWVSVQRGKYKRGLLTTEQIKTFEALPGWCWNAWDRQWQPAMAALDSFRAREGHARVPVHHIENGFELGVLVARQRSRYSVDKQRQADQLDYDARESKGQLKEGEKRPKLILSADSRRALERIPEWSENWKASESVRLWNLKLDLLKRFVAKHGHSDVPRDHSEKGLTLGIWVNSIRAQYNRGALDQERVKELESINGWKWARHRHDVHEAGFDGLARFIQQFGHANVPRNYVSQGGLRLGDWVGKKQASYKRGTLNQRDILRLDEIPQWNWSVRRGKLR